jgi:oligopeptide/dipeptide ABC transporter ATP-binding protein
LQQSIPALHEKGQPLFTIPGLPPDLTKDLTGCPFAPRCIHVRDECSSQRALLREMSLGHKTSCLRFQNGELADLRLKHAVIG